MHRATGGLIACVALWGAVFIGVHQLLPELDPLQMITLRFTIVGAAFALLLAARPQLRPRVVRRDWGLVVAAALTAVPLSQLPIIDGQRFLSPPIAALIVTFSPAVAAMLDRERVSARSALGFVVALAGVAMIVVLGAGSGAESRGRRIRCGLRSRCSRRSRGRYTRCCQSRSPSAMTQREAWV